LYKDYDYDYDAEKQSLFIDFDFFCFNEETNGLFIFDDCFVLI